MVSVSINHCMFETCILITKMTLFCQDNYYVMYIIFLQLQNAMTLMFILLKVKYLLIAELRYAWMGFGEIYVTACGILVMLELYADS